MPEPNIDKTHKESQLLHIHLFFAGKRKLLLEEMYLDAVDGFCQPACMMKCSRCPKGSILFICTTQEDQTQFQEFLIVFPYMNPFQCCLAIIHICYGNN